jgi:hypothetical protein
MAGVRFAILQDRNVLVMGNLASPIVEFIEKSVGSARVCWAFSGWPGNADFPLPARDRVFTFGIT